MSRFPVRRSREISNYAIQYAQELPPGEGPNVRANLDVDTGAGTMGRALEQAGGQLAEQGLAIMNRIQAAEDSAEIDTFRRQEGEAWNALQQTIDTSTDPDANGKAWEAYNKTVAGLKSKRANVNEAWQSYWNREFPQRQATFQWANLKRRRALLAERSEENDTADYLNPKAEEGLKNFALRREKEHALGVISKEKMESDIAAFPQTSRLEQMRRAAAGGNPALVEKLNEGLDESKLTTEQLEYRNKVVKAAREQGRQNAQEAVVSIVFSMRDNNAKTPTEKIALADQYARQLRAAGISGEEARTMVDRIDRWAGGDMRGVQTNKIVQADLINRIVNLTEESSSYDVNLLMQDVYRNAHNLDNEDFPAMVQMVSNRIKEEQADALKAAMVATGLEDLPRQRARVQRAVYRELMALKELKKAEWGPKEVYQYATAMAALVKAKANVEDIAPMTTAPAPEIRQRPAEYPDAVWNEQHQMWTVIRNGRLMGVK